jgi:hypothetical protein
VNTLARTVAFLWVGNPSKLKVTALLLKDMTSITFWEYKKIDYKVELAVEFVVPLKVTFFTNEVPKTVVLSIVYKKWSLLFEAKVHSLGIPAEGVAEYVRRVELQL